VLALSMLNIPPAGPVPRAPVDHHRMFNTRQVPFPAVLMVRSARLGLNSDTVSPKGVCVEFKLPYVTVSWYMLSHAVDDSAPLRFVGTPRSSTALLLLKLPLLPAVGTSPPCLGTRRRWTARCGWGCRREASRSWWGRGAWASHNCATCWPSPPLCRWSWEGESPHRRHRPPPVH
jgi:hypothetical protein